MDYNRSARKESQSGREESGIGSGDVTNCANVSKRTDFGWNRIGKSAGGASTVIESGITRGSGGTKGQSL